MEFDSFEQLDDAKQFCAIVKGHHLQAFSSITQIASIEPVIDDDRLELAFNQYSLNVQSFAVLLDSKNPDQYKRSGALLHALYKARPITGVLIDGHKPEDLEMNWALGVNHDEAGELLTSFRQEFADFANEILAFDLAFGCCQVYEQNLKSYNQDFLDNMIYYMSESSNLSMQSFAMILKGLML